MTAPFLFPPPLNIRKMQEEAVEMAKANAGASATASLSNGPEVCSLPSSVINDDTHRAGPETSHHSDLTCM